MNDIQRNKSKSKRTPMVFAAVVSALFIMSFAGPSGAFHEPEHAIVEIALGNDYEEDFQADDGGWDANEYDPVTRPDPRNPSWAWGAPTSGPGAAHTGTNVWATNLDGNFNADECAAIASPVIDLSDATAASVSFAHWTHMNTYFSGNAYDAGALFVTADGGETFTYLQSDDYDALIGWSPTRTCLDARPFSPGEERMSFTGASGGWNEVAVALDDFVGQEVQFVFGFGSRNNAAAVLPGWYLDAFQVTIDGDTTVEDFENGDGGFTLMSTHPKPLAQQGWSWDAPTTGPSVANETRLWATNPHGNYGPNECSYLESVPIVVGEDYPNAANAIIQAQLSWEQYFRTNSGIGQGVVQIGVDGNYTNIVPDEGYPGTTRFSKDIHYECLDPEEDQVFAGFHNAAGDPMVEYGANISAYLGQEITVRFAFATSESTLMNDGWFIDNVRIDLSAAIYPPIAVDDTIDEILGNLPDPTGGSTPLGWSIGGDDPTWDYGVASTGPEGETVFMTNLDGNHAPNECGWAETPAVPGAILALDPTLRFEHWYNTYLSFSSGPWGAGIVLVSTNGGANWTLLDVDNYNHAIDGAIARSCFQDALDMDYPVAGSFAGESGEFVSSTADLSDFIGEDEVQFRFVFGTGTSITRDGWALKSVEVAGISLF